MGWAHSRQNQLAVLLDSSARQRYLPRLAIGSASVRGKGGDNAPRNLGGRGTVRALDGVAGAGTIGVRGHGRPESVATDLPPGGPQPFDRPVAGRHRRAKPLQLFGPV